MEISIGIDLGTTFSVAAFVNEFGEATEIPDPQRGQKTIFPSVVFYKGEGRFDVGDAALSTIEVFPEKTIRSAKRFMNEVFTPPSGVPQDETPVKFQSKILKAIKDYVEAPQNGYTVKNAVITVPAYFDSMKRNLTREAAEIAGIDCLGIINEPMAAAIYYCHCEGIVPNNQKFLVYDLGGGTFDVVLIEYRTDDTGVTVIETLAQAGDHQLGGDDWDIKLMEFILSKARASEEGSGLPAYLEDMDSKDRQKLRSAANQAKESLSFNPDREIVVEINGNSFIVEVTRDDFDGVTKSYLDDTGALVDKVLGYASLKESDIDLVLLVGGSTNMPMVQKYVNGKFGAEKVKYNNVNLAVAYGAAIYAVKLSDFQERMSEQKSESGQSETGEIAGVQTSDGQTVVQQNQGGIRIPAPPPMKVILNASHSIGVHSLIGGTTEDNLYVKNLVICGQSYEDETGIEATQTFASNQDGGFTVLFYSNECRNADEPIRVYKNDATTSFEDAYVSHTEPVKYLAQVTFNDDAIKEDDPIEITIRDNQNGAFADVCHLSTGKKERDIVLMNRESLNPDEIQREKEKLNIARVGR